MKINERQRKTLAVASVFVLGITLVMGTITLISGSQENSCSSQYEKAEKGEVELSDISEECQPIPASVERKALSGSLLS